MPQRQLHRVQDRRLDVLQPADILPLHIWHLGGADLHRGPGLDAADGRVEVGGAHGWQVVRVPAVPLAALLGGWLLGAGASCCWCSRICATAATGFCCFCCRRVGQSVCHHAKHVSWQQPHHLRRSRRHHVLADPLPAPGSHCYCGSSGAVRGGCCAAVGGDRLPQRRQQAVQQGLVLIPLHHPHLKLVSETARQVGRHVVQTGGAANHHD